MKTAVQTCMMITLIWALTVSLGLAAGTTDDGTETAGTTPGVEQRIQHLEDAIQELNKAGGKWTDHIEINGEIEVEARSSRDYADVDTSEVALATADLGIEAQLAEWCTGYMLFSWDEGVDVDEGYIRLGATEDYPLYLRAGLIYVPFGVYETHMISDPLTLEIGETREQGLQVGSEYRGFYGSLYLFNGDVQEGADDGDDTIEAYGANIGYMMERDRFGLDIGVDYMSNMLDSDGLGDGFEASRSEFVGNNPDGSFTLDDYVAGMGAHVLVTVGPVCLIGEYIGATDDVDYITDDGSGTRVNVSREKPAAYHIEGAFTFEAMKKDITLAATCQGTDNLAGVLPEKRYGASAGIGLTEQLGLAVEYIHDEDYDERDGGTDESAQTCAMNVTLVF